MPDTLPPYLLAALEVAEDPNTPRDPATGELTPEGQAQVRACLEQADEKEKS